MRILLVSNLYPPQELGGYGRSLADFAWGLQQRGHALHVLCADAPYLGPAGPGPSGEPVQRALQLKGSFAQGVSLIRDAAVCCAVDQHNAAMVHRVLGQQRFDGILLGNLDLLGPELLAVLLATRLPLLHHVGFMAPPFAPMHWPLQQHYMLVGASYAVRASLQQAGLPVAAAPVVYPGARVELFGPAATGRPLPPPLGWAGTAPLGTAANPLRLAFAGLLMGSKGAHTVVEAAARLHHAGVALQLNLAGAAFQADYWPQLQALAQQAGLGGLVQWVGQLQRPQLARFLGLHHVGVFASIYPEAFGIVGAEIQASGLALVSSGVGGAAELLDHGISGLRFEAGNSADLAQQLLRLVREPGLLQRLQQAGTAQVQARFSVQQSAVQLERLFVDQACSRRPASRGSITF
jgi:glycosyltransferase involved in cell wall biosynthesis